LGWDEAWGARADDWAEVQEAMFRPLHTALVTKTVRPGITLLDLGCGSGAFCQMASAAGAIVSGIDVTPELVAIARRRVPGGDFGVADMQDLPHEDDRFDLVMGINSLHQVDSPLQALREARRVARPGGAVVVATWGRVEDCEAMGALHSLDVALAWNEDDEASRAGRRGSLEETLLEAGLKPEDGGEVTCRWAYPDQVTMLRGMMAAGPVETRTQAAGEDKVRECLVDAMTPFRTDSGGYSLMNAFRYITTRA
jgi:SAM-dependent methyltransferase